MEILPNDVSIKSSSHHQIRCENVEVEQLKPIEKVELIIMLLWMRRTIGNHHIDAFYLTSDGMAERSNRRRRARRLHCVAVQVAPYTHAMHDAWPSQAHSFTSFVIIIVAAWARRVGYTLRTVNGWHVNTLHSNYPFNHSIRSRRAPFVCAIRVRILRRIYSDCTRPASSQSNRSAAVCIRFGVSILVPRSELLQQNPNFH